jgi:alanine racemase
MFNSYRPYFAEINLDNFRHNFREVKRLAKGKKTIGVIKADGYGHGAAELARILEEEDADYFAVAVITEALELRHAGFKKPILILGFTPPTFAGDLVENDITQAVFTYDLADAISKEAVKQNKIAKIHIKLDTGMGRVGYIPSEEAILEIKRISSLKNLKIEGIFSHFATADEVSKEFSHRQYEKFNNTIKQLESEGIKFEVRHISNSAAIIDMPETYYDAVRPGIMLYGYYPSDEVIKERLELKPVMTLKANVVHVKVVPENTPVSYGRKFYTKKESKIATLPFGYADGFTRLLFGKVKVIVDGKLVPVVGRICMDQCMIDVSECGDVKVGDEVIVMGECGNIRNNADDYAQILGTINYEILCMVAKRVPRVYYENGRIIKVKNYV